MKINKQTGQYEWQYLDKEEWFKIEEELGEVTDVEVKQIEGNAKGNTVVSYKSNGVEKKMYFIGSELKPLIQSIIYCAKEFDPRATQNIDNQQ